MGIGDGDGDADEFEASEVIEVVAEEDDAGGVELVLFEPAAKGIYLGGDAVETREAEFFAAAEDDRVGFGGEDQDLAGENREEAGEGKAIAATAYDGLLAGLGEVDPVVGEDAIEVEDHSVDVGRDKGATIMVEKSAGDGLDEDEVVLFVDFHAVRRRKLPADGFAKEAMAGGEEARDIEEVGGTVFHDFRGAVLAAGTVGLIVVDAGPVAVGALAPKEAMGRHAGEGGVGTGGEGVGDEAVEVRGAGEGAGALKEEQAVWMVALGVPDLEAVDQGGFGGSGVVGEIGGAIDHLGSSGACGGGDQRIVGGDGNAIHLGAAEGGADGVNEEGESGDGAEVFAGNALGAAAGGDDDTDLHGKKE